jgi:hypothetical protein
MMKLLIKCRFQAPGLTLLDETWRLKTASSVNIKSLNYLPGTANSDLLPLPRPATALPTPF